MLIRVKSLPPNAGDIRDVGLIPGLGRSPGGGRGKPTPVFFSGESQDREAWQVTVRRVAQSEMSVE